MDRPRIVVVQYAGDVANDAERLARGEPETYRGQRYTVEAVQNLGRFGSVTNITLLSPRAGTTTLAGGVRCVDLGLSEHPRDLSAVRDCIARERPTHVVMRFLSRQLLDWVSRRGSPVRTLALLAEIHLARGGLRGLVQSWRNLRLAAVLNRPGIEWVANHHLIATRWLREIGVRPRKLIAYDYEYALAPRDFPAKGARSSGPWRVGYAGMLVEGKGVGDLIEAVARVRRAGHEVTLHLAGGGADRGRFEALAARLGIADEVAFLGSLPNPEVIPFMRSCDAVVVPSRPEYSESFGFVVQEAFTSRTPLIASDHRAFEGRVLDGVTGLVYPAGDAEALAGRLIRLRSEPLLYRRLSEGTEQAWERMQIPVKWADLLYRWLADRPEDRDWLAEQCLGRSGGRSIPGEQS